MLSEAVILAGGFGTRLQTVISDVPKPMAPVNGKPFLSYILDYLRYYELKHVVISTGHLADKITTFYKSDYKGIDITYTHEATPLGTGGGIRLALEQCKTNDVLILNGDSFFEIDLRFYQRQHRNYESKCSLSLRKVDDASRYGTIDTDGNHRITSFTEKNGLAKPGLINAGVYIINRELYLSETSPDMNFSIEKDFFEQKIGTIKMQGFEYPGYFIDIGIPDDYSKIQNDFKEFKYK